MQEVSLHEDRGPAEKHVAGEIKRTFKQSLEGVVDPDGVYWNYPGDDTDDPERVRLVEVRLDVPTASVAVAQAEMQRDGWILVSQPDEAASDPMQRLYFRKEQSLCRDHKIAMLTRSLRAAYRTNGTFWSWVNTEDADEARFRR